MIFTVYYMKPDRFRDLNSGQSFDAIDVDDLSKTHCQVKEVDIRVGKPDGVHLLDKVFFAMQAEIWSPKGEARDLIESLGLGHTSMSVGDVIEYYWGTHRFTVAVAPMGYKKLS